MSPDKQKVSAVKEWAMPQSTADVRTFLGLALYHRHYIQSFSNIAKPLHELIQKNAKFVWSWEHNESFNALKDKLVQAPVLMCPLIVGWDHNWQKHENGG